MPELARWQFDLIARAVATLLPAHPSLDDVARAAVEQDVTAFVTRQVAALPVHLGVPYALLTAAFGLLPVFRHGRTFGRLDLPRRAARLAAWDDSSISAFRNHVKLIRGCALLAYYDHPAVRQALGATAWSTTRTSDEGAP